ncbi:hypothetical protein Goshw_023647 [Gossypium schwendimanii]|uniref:Photosystem I reaction center subunit N, chloroplastic n=1 Tax=Gossypium schwendimanii TaxID=34291 RepID=A0A7J9MPM0_GOSSC|nr:hypothetical protein [Gossypium schwendimanii]
MEASQSQASANAALNPHSNPNGNYTNNSNSILSSTPVWPTIDGPLGLSEEESLAYARRFYKFGYALLPFLWVVNCFYFWPVLRHSRSFPRLRPYVVSSAIGFSVFSVILSSWALTFAIGGEHLFGSTWDQLVMYNVADRLGLTVPFVAMAAMNSSVLACNYAISGSGLNAKIPSVPSVASPVLPGGHKLPVIRAQQQGKVSGSKESRGNEGRRAAMLYLAATLFTTAAASSANAGVIDDYLEKSKANKELNDKKRLATSGANFARAYTVQFGTCKFPENFTGCQDLAKQKKVPFISDDLALECEGKDKYKCGSNVFWKW